MKVLEAARTGRRGAVGAWPPATWCSPVPSSQRPHGVERPGPDSQVAAQDVGRSFYAI